MARHTLNHASIRVREISRSREFYEGVLGFSTAPRPDLGFPGAWYDLGGGQLHLIQQAQQTFDGIDPTAPHFAVQVASLAEVKKTLEARGIAYLEFGGSQLWVRDPDGNVVELCGPA